MPPRGDRPASLNSLLRCGALLFVALDAGGVRASEDPHGTWAPAGGAPITAAVAERIPKDGAECVEQAVKRAHFEPSFVADSLTGGPGMMLDRYKEAFAACMVERGWQRVDAAEFEARRVTGQVEDCLAGVPALCQGAVSAYVHGVSGAVLDAKKGLDAGRQMCARGIVGACLTTASLALDPPQGRGLSGDGKLALSLAQTGCDAGDAECCGFAGVLLSTGAADVARDPTRGAKLLARACAGGARSACNWPDGAPQERINATPAATDRWCRYGAPNVAGGLGCGEVPVAWISVPGGDDCAPRVSVDVGTCRYEYRLGQ